jgi:four helix bundle protein
MQNPKNLRAYPVAQDLAVAIYELTRRFPRDERFGLTSQMRRAAVSIGSNIAEGCGRRGNRALLAFIYVAMGSANELDFQLRLAVRLQFATSSEAQVTYQLLQAARRMLASLSSQLRSRADVPP